MATWPVSPDRIQSLEEHMQAIGKNPRSRAARIEMMDSLIDGYLSSPVKELRERVARDEKRLSDRLSALESEELLRNLGATRD